MYYGNSFVLFDDYLDNIEVNGITPEKMHNKIQCFASSLGLNNCVKDMHKIASKGCVCVEMWQSKDFRDNLIKRFEIKIVNKDERQEIRRLDYSFHTIHSHLFFEIPVVNNFNNNMIIKWQKYCINELNKLCLKNPKKRDIWLRAKKMAQDFE